MEDFGRKKARYLVVGAVAKALGVPNAISPTVHNWLAFHVSTPVREFFWWKVMRQRERPITVRW